MNKYSWLSSLYLRRQLRALTDYDSEEEGDGYEDASNEYVTSEFPDEGLGESDSRSYYAEDPGKYPREICMRSA